MPNIRQTIRITTRIIDLIGSKNYLCLVMYPNDRGKVKITVNDDADTSFDTIYNSPDINAGVYVIGVVNVEVSLTQRKVLLGLTINSPNNPPLLGLPQLLWNYPMILLLLV